MKLQNHVRNEFGMTDTPENTVSRIADGFRRLGYDIAYAPFQMADHIHWSQIGIDRIGLQCQGKGMTPQLAEASAHAELAERFSGGLFYPAFEEQVRFHLPALYGRQVSRFLNYEWLPGYVHAHQTDLGGDCLPIESLLAHQSQLRPADIAAIKDSRLARHWVDGYSLLQQRTVKVPINFVAYINASNGMAAGNTVEEALVQAACEVFERHTQIQIVRPEKTVPTIDPKTVTDARLREMMAFYERQNVEIVLKDLSMDGRFPSVGTLYINHNLRPGRLEHRILVPGVSFHMNEALSRCLTEVMQGRSTLKRPSPGLDKPISPHSRVENLYLMFKCCISQKDISFLEQGETVAYRNLRSADLFDEIEGIRQICQALDTDFIVLDLTHPVLQFPVVRVVVPGVSDFLPFVYPDILTRPDTNPDAAWRGDSFKRLMETFFERPSARNAPRPGVVSRGATCPHLVEFFKYCFLRGTVFWTYHVNMRITGRFIPRDSILEAVDTFEIVEAYPEDKYLPSYLVLGRSGEGSFHLVVAVDVQGDNVRIVTAYRLDAGEWYDDMRTRRPKP